MTKTYVDLGKYFGRWTIQLAAQADTTAKVTALANLVACIAEFLAVWTKPPLNP